VLATDNPFQDPKILCEICK